MDEFNQPVNPGAITEEDQTSLEKLIAVRSTPETVRIWNEVKDKYPTQKEALGALIQKGADAIAREEAGSDVADVTKEVIAVRNLTRRICQLFEEGVRKSTSDLRLAKEDTERDRATLNEKINELRDRLDILTKEKKEALQASKTALERAENLETRNKELEMSVTNSVYTTESLRKSNESLTLRIENVAQVEAKLVEANKSRQGLMESVRQSSAKIELLTTRNTELTELIKLEREGHARELKDVQANHTAELKELRAEIASQREAHRSEISQMRSDATAEQRQLRESLQAEHIQTMKDLRQDAKDRLESAVAQVEQTCQARIRAEVIEATSQLKGEIDKHLQTINQLKAELEMINVQKGTTTTKS